MKIEQLDICNQKIHMTNICMNFDKVGIYRISGQNAAGKTTILEEILYGKYQASFQEETQKAAFENGRSKLFAYVPQNISTNDISVYHYIKKEDNRINKELVNVYLEKFLMPHVKLNSKMVHLSGGEKIKAAIIAAILKDTPYIFMDEPTNHMDDESVEVFLDIIKELAQRKTIILVTHDPRVEVEYVCSYHIEHQNVTCERQQESYHNHVNKVVCDWQKISTFKVIKSFLKYRKLKFVLYYIWVLLICLAVFNKFQFLMEYSYETIPKGGCICLYATDCEYGELNQIYVKGAGLKVEPENYKKMVEFEDVPNISKMEGVQDIILLNVTYLEKMWESYTAGEEELLKGNYVLSLPEILSEEEYNSSTMLHPFVEKTVDGRFPKDGKKEVALSHGLLKKYHRYKTDELECAIGNKIEVEGETYTIVGILNEDITIISYDKGKENLGLYTYSSDTYKNYTEEQKKYRKKINYYLSNEIEGWIILDTKLEKQIQDKLMVTYPAHNYASRAYAIEWLQQYNQEFLLKLIGMNLIMCLIFSIFFYLVSKNTINTQLNLIKDYECYYLEKRKIKYSYILSQILEYAVIIGVCMLANGFIIKNQNISSIILLFDGIALSGTFLIGSIKGMKKND